MSLTKIAFSGSALSISNAARCGFIGVPVSSENPGATNLSPFLPISIDLLQPFLASIGALGQIGAAIEFGVNLPQECAHVSH